MVRHSSTVSHPCDRSLDEGMRLLVVGCACFASTGLRGPGEHSAAFCSNRDSARGLQEMGSRASMGGWGVEI